MQYLYAGLLTVLATGNSPEDAKPLPDVVGINHINSHYHLTDGDYINEGADQVLALGSRVIKLIIRDRLEGYYTFNTEWPEITSLVQAAETPFFKEVLAKPFTTYVLPNTHCDLYSYSAYDTMGQNEEKYRSALQYLLEKAPDSATFGANNVYIGEFGWPESLVSEEQRLNMIRYSVEGALNIGAPWILFWELYCDGPKADRTPPFDNDEMVGN